MQAKAVARWRVKGPEMVGLVARWYARIRGTESQIETYRKEAGRLTGSLPAGARGLEAGFGPGHPSNEVARLRRVQVAGLDTSPTCLKMSSHKARQAGAPAACH